MQVFNQFLSKNGRLSRRGYVLFFVMPGAMLLGLTIAAFTFAPQLAASQFSPAVSIGWLVYLTTMDAQNIRRYHDLGNSGALYSMLRPLLVVLPLIAFAIQFLIPAQMASAGNMDALAYMIEQEVAFNMSPVPLAIMALWLFGLAANIAYLAIMPGHQGPNSFGSDPRGGSGAPLAADASGDPVERTLAGYHASLAQAKARSVRAIAAPPAATFGRKR